VSEVVVEVEDLFKTFRIGFFRRKVEAVRGVGFQVRRGEIFGLLGPNGAGKTTTIKMLLRLIFPDRGTLRIFGAPPGPEVLRRVGYLPENPYVYQYLRPLEFLDLCGRLTGMDAAERAEGGRRMVERVGLGHALDRPIGKFSKGMMQRIGLAQALLHQPELLILDEPMSGLDPVGRKEVSDLIEQERRRGTTLLFTSHILSDVERLCDRVCILHHGRVKHQGALHALLRGESEGVELEVGPGETLPADLAAEAERLESGGQRLVLPRAELPAVLTRLFDAGVAIETVHPRRERLESLFVDDDDG
jgi:ABC-2 type transport system ATP-binding protein